MSKKKPVKQSPPLRVKVNSMSSLAKNIQDNLASGCTLVSQIEQNGMLYYVVQNELGIKIKLEAQNCEIINKIK